ncbi:hypothetical protein PQO01_05260 [Lentisphaera marina]|uniref:hypothetical protein n=1 Tax=Lentisphaera marina TaxID=1111041 RepID=UPI0023671B57|nr:hypothetical protein [Lentisphaera marina]MDD7984354.1 hypothetical protein [Lentisphaera marina]
MKLLLNLIAFNLALLICSVNSAPFSFCLETDELFIIECPQVTPENHCSCSSKNSNLQVNQTQKSLLPTGCCLEFEAVNSELSQQLNSDWVFAAVKVSSIPQYFAPLEDLPKQLSHRTPQQANAPPFYILYQSFLC